MLNSFGGHVGGLASALFAILVMKATPSELGIITAAQAIPFTFFALPAGVFLDRRSKLPILLVCETIQALTLISVPTAYWLGVLSIHWMYVSAFILGSCSVIGGGAEQIFLTFLIGRDGMLDAQSKLAATDSASRLLAPGLAGVLIQWLTAPFAMLFNGLCFLIAMLNLRRIGVRDPTPAPSDKHPLRDIHDGFVFIWGHPLLRTLAWAAGCWHILFYGAAALGVLFATKELHMSPGMLGVAQMISGLGVFASSLVVKPLNRRFGPGGTFLVGTATTTLGFVLTPMIPATLFGSPMATAAAYVTLVFFFDCGVMLFFMPYMAMRQKVTPDAYLGRMISTMRFLTIAIAPLGALAAGYIAEHYSIRTAQACIGAGAVLLTTAILMSRAIRGAGPDPSPSVIACADKTS